LRSVGVVFDNRLFHRRLFEAVT